MTTCLTLEDLISLGDDLDVGPIRDLVVGMAAGWVAAEVAASMLEHWRKWSAPSDTNSQ